ncbi:MAG: hypothetical protein ACD_19C00016G0041 [uncultured bacterium]|nr:MAG: hypothetical protein ACD_19C00016G0041 [uncultured bacterium]
MKNQKGFIPVIIILVVLIGFVGVYYLGTLKPNKVTESPTPIATDDSALRWKTYLDNEVVVSSYSEFVEKSKKSQPAIFISSNYYYNTKIKSCDNLPITENCFVGSLSWGQPETIKNIILDSKPAISYFVNDSIIGEPTYLVARNIYLGQN